MQATPGWYPDPVGRFAQRWWDGWRWTDRVVAADGRMVTDPAPVIVPTGPEVASSTGVPWYHNPVTVIAAAFLCFPAALALVWTHPRWDRRTRMAWSGAIAGSVLVFAVVAAVSPGTDERVATAPSSGPVPTLERRSEPTPSSTSTSTTSTTASTTTTTTTPPDPAIDDVRGLSALAAAAAMLDLGFDVRIEKYFNATYASGQVYDQDPAPGRYPPGTSVVLYQSLGPEPATTTTAAPPPTTSPPPPPPPTTVAPTTAPPFGGGCSPNYSGCVPVASDVDCAGGSGNGPAYVSGPVQVIGSDVYGLDHDGDGVGCE